jgi:predicted transposase/invertase (TIGR01784 family)
MTMKFVDPKTDIAFKKIFSNEAHKEILQEFLNEILILESPIASLEILNPYQVPKLYDLKVTSLDIKAKDQFEREFLIEMQVAKEDWFLQRAMYYSAKSYSQQLKIGGNYQALRPVIFLGILNFKAFEHERYFSRHAILDVQTSERHLHELEFNFIELPKFKKTENELETAAEKWIYFLKQAKNLDHIPENTDFSSLQTAYQIAEQHQWSRDELEVYDAQEKEAHRQHNVEQTAWKDGLKKGIEQGIEQGEKAKALAIAKGMLAKGLDLETIAELTALTHAEIQNLI